MSQPSCELCSRPMPDTAYVCPVCTKGPCEDLGRIADLAGEPAVTIARQSRHGDGGKASDGHPLPVDLVAARRAAAVEVSVTTWARHVSETRGLPIAEPPRLVGPPCGQGWCRHASCRVVRNPAPVTGLGLAAGWLVGQLDWLRHRREAAEAFADFRRAASELLSIAGGPLPRWYAGQCWEMVADESGEEHRCEADLYAAPGADTVRCPECKAVHDTHHRKDWLLEQANDALVHAELMARALTALGVEDVTPARIRGMFRHGRLAAHGADAAGRQLFKVGEVLGLIDEQARIEEDRKRRREVKAAKKAAAADGPA